MSRLSLGRLRARTRRLLDRPASIELAPYEKLLPRIAAAEDEIHELSADELREAALALPEGTWKDAHKVRFAALAREAAHRALDERPFDVQIVGMLALLDGNVVQMSTGEGKTLVAAMAAAGYVRQGRRVHVMSVNDYLAARDADWMGSLYELLGIEAGSIRTETPADDRRTAYERPVLHAAVHEIGFDVLRDRQARTPEEQVGAEPDVLIIDEADSVLIDEARIPMILAGSAAAPQTEDLADLIRELSPSADYTVYDDGRNVGLTDAGVEKVEKRLGHVDLYAPQNLALHTSVNLALQAEVLVRRDVDYLIEDNKVRLVSASRGRVDRLQRWPDGLQAAVEAKEGLPITDAGEVLDSITVRALIARYATVCGLTGTAAAVAEELNELYGLQVAVVPTNEPVIREDEPERIYATREQRDAALIDRIAEEHAGGRPILVGTLDVAESERLAEALIARDIPVQVLNARNEDREAAIVAEAGAPGTVTVSTQMAGRGVDIRLGGSDSAEHEKVAGLGGLLVLAAGHYSSIRLDEQLRGRAGRQGDPGTSALYASAQDELVEHYLDEGDVDFPADDDGLISDPEAIHKMGHAQRVAAGVILEIVRNTWRFEKLTEQQRAGVVEQREAVLHGEAGARLIADRNPDGWDVACEKLGDDDAEELARRIVLHRIDQEWIDYLAFLAELREGIHMRALGKLDPIEEFQRESGTVFAELSERTVTGVVDAFDEAVEQSDGSLPPEDRVAPRPTTTWTYVVQENPYGSEFDRALNSIAAKLRRRIR